jgi:hypothetical protein
MRVFLSPLPPLLFCPTATPLFFFLLTSWWRGMCLVLIPTQHGFRSRSFTPVPLIIGGCFSLFNKPQVRSLVYGLQNNIILFSARFLFLLFLFRILAFYAVPMTFKNLKRGD